MAAEGEKQGQVANLSLGPRTKKSHARKRQSKGVGFESLLFGRATAGREWFDLGFEAAAEGGAGLLQIVGLLESQPEAFPGAEEAAVTERRVCRNRTATFRDFSGSRRWNAGALAYLRAGQVVRRDPLRK